MQGKFRAQSLAETRTKHDERRVEVTFVDTVGARQTISLPAAVAADLVPVLKALSAELSAPSKAQLTRMPRQMAVGTARNERLVLVRFDDDPPYGFDPDEAETLWRAVREEAEQVSRLSAPLRQ
jgi:hypothetical protein